ncbi:hypothetical protein BGZ91_006418 [Linnemannia elongata]|nr:hypothetical protein BGZ91_006418 [Linnemannia elongata]
MEQIDDDKTVEATSAENLHTTEAEDEEKTDRRTSTSNDQDESIEIIEDSDPVAIMRTEDSQMTLITPSQEDESNLTPEGSFIEGSMTDAAEDLIDAARRMEREESLVSGLDSDAGTDRKESKRSSRKRDSRQSTPIRATRRSTRSQTSKLDEEIIITQETTTTTTTISHEDVVLNTANDDIESLEQELAQTDARIADKIQKSQDLIDASEELLHQSESLDEQAERVLADSEDLFATGADDDEEKFAQREDDEDQTFHSTKQFEPVDDAEEENGESETPLYPVLDEEVDVKFYPDDEEDDQENADTVKYYASESPAATGLIDVEMEDEAQTPPQDDVQEQEQEQERARDKDLREQVTIALEPPSRNPSPPAASLSSASPLRDGEEVAFSPMVLSRSPTPAFVPSTPPTTERFEDCLPIVTPKAERVKPKSAIEEALPMSNVEFLADFFKEQKGRALTREQANHCQKLIEEAVRPYTSTSKRLEAVSSSLEALKPVPGHASTITTHAALITEQSSSLEPITTPIANVSHRVPKRAAPFEVKRQAISDLYHDDKAETAHRPALPPLDEYLEIKKYEGVDWDDLPNQVKVKRLLEWKGTEAPEVLKRRKIEERRLMKEKNAEVWGRDKKDYASEQATKGASALKRSVTTSGMFSDDDEDEEPLQHKKSSTGKPATASASLIAQPALAATAAAATANAATKDTKAADTPKVSSIAQKLLDIVGKGSKVEDEDAAEKSVERITDNVAKTAAAEKTASSTTLAVASPFNFGVPSAAKENTSETSKPAPFSFGKSEANTSITSTLGFGTPAATESTPDAASSGSIFAKPATITPVPTSTSAPSQSAAPGFSFSTPASDSKEVSKSPFNFGVPSASPAVSSGVLAAASPFALESGSSKEISTTTTTKPAASPFGAAPSFSFGDAKSPSLEISTASPFGAASTSGFSFGAPKSPTTEKKTTSSPFAAAGSGFSFGVPKSPTAEKSTASPFGASSGISFGVPKSPSASKSTTSPFGTVSGSPFGAPKSPTAEKTSTFSSSGFSSFSSTSAGTKPTAAPTFNFGVTPGFAAAGAFGGAAAATSFAPAKFGSSTGSASANPFAAITSMGQKKDEEPEVILLSDEEDVEGEEDDDGDNGGQEYSGDEEQYDDDEDDQHEGTGSYEGEGDEYSQEDSYGGEEDDYGDEDGDEDDQEEEDGEDKAKAKAAQAASKPGGMFNFAPSGNPFGQAVSSSSVASAFSLPAPKSPEFDFTFGSSTTTTKVGGGGGFGSFSGFGAGPLTTTPSHKSRSGDSGNISDLEMSPVLTYRAGSVDTDEGEISPLSSPVLGPQH